MGFNVIKEEKKYLVAVDKELNNRWAVIDFHNYKNNNIEDKFSFINETKINRTKFLLGYDNLEEKLVIIKTINYEDEKSFNKNKKALEEQWQLLRKNLSFLPKALDFFYVNQSYLENNFNLNKGNNSQKIEKNIPVMILEYNANETLLKKIESGIFQNKNAIDVARVMDITKKLLKIIKDLEKAKYGDSALSLEHILISEKDEITITGIGSICPLKGDKLDKNSENFSRTIFGYSAPELNDLKLNWGEDATAAELGCFSLGVIIYQMISGSFLFNQSIIKNGSFYYKEDINGEKIKLQKNGHRISNLIANLSNHNEKERLVDYDRIESILDEISNPLKEENLSIKPFIIPEEKEIIYKGLTGYIKSYNKEKGHGFIKAEREEYYLRKKELVESKINEVQEGLELNFDVVKDNKGMIYAFNISVENSEIIDVFEEDGLDNGDYEGSNSKENLEDEFYYDGYGEEGVFKKLSSWVRSLLKKEDNI